MTITELLAVLGFVSSILTFILGNYYNKNKTRAEANKAEAEAQETKGSTRKIEAEVAAQYIISAGELVGEYKTMLDQVNKKVEAMEERQGQTDKKLDEEIKNRQSLERITLEVYSGFKTLLSQLEKASMIPDWKLNAKVEAELMKMEEKHNEITYH